MVAEPTAESLAFEPITQVLAGPGLELWGEEGVVVSVGRASREVRGRKGRFGVMHIAVDHKAIARQRILRATPFRHGAITARADEADDRFGTKQSRRRGGRTLSVTAREAITSACRGSPVSLQPKAVVSHPPQCSHDKKAPGSRARTAPPGTTRRVDRAARSPRCRRGRAPSRDVA